MELKKTAIAIGVAFSIGVMSPPTINLSHAQGIPVIDGQSIAQVIMNNIKEMAEWAKQIEAMNEQINTMKSTLAALKGANKIGDYVKAAKSIGGTLEKGKEFLDFVDQKLNGEINEEMKKLNCPGNEMPKTRAACRNVAKSIVARNVLNREIDQLQKQIKTLYEFRALDNGHLNPGDKQDFENAIKKLENDINDREQTIIECQQKINDDYKDLEFKALREFQCLKFKKYCYDESI